MNLIDQSLTFTLEPLRHSGNEVDLPPGIRLFDDADSVWLVWEGSIELIAVMRTDGRQSGAREHLGTLVRGSLIWGIEQDAEVDGLQITCFNVAPAQLMRLSVASLLTLCAAEASEAVLAPAIDQWITALSRGAARYIYQRRPPDLGIAVGETLTLPQGNRVTCRKGVVWAEMAPGGGKFLDIAPIAGPLSPVFVPLTPQTWFEATSPVDMTGRDTEALLRLPGLASRMDQFHAWIMHTTSVGFRNAAGAEVSRLARRKAKVTADTEHTFFGFAALLDRSRGEGTPKPADNALFDCCSLVASQLGMDLTMPPWARRRRAGDKPLDVEDIAIASQVRVRQVVLRGRWWKEDNGPLVAYANDDNRPIALLPRGNGRSYVMRDAASGKELPVTERLAETLTGQAHFFCASLPLRPLSIGDLLLFGIASCRKDLAMLALAGALGGLVATGIPLLTGYVFDTVIPGHQTPQMVQVGLALLAAALSSTVFRLSADIAQLRVEGKMSGRLQAAVMDRLLRLPEHFFSNFSSGDLAQRTMVIETIRRTLSGPVLGSLVAGIFSIFSFALLFHYAPMVALLACLLTIIMGGVSCLVGMRVVKAVMASETKSGKLSGLVLEIVSGIVKLRLAGAEERAFNVWAGRFFELRKDQIEVRRTFNIYTIFWAGYEIFSLTIIFGAIAASAGSNLSTGNFLAFIAAFSGFMTTTSSLALSVLTVFGVAPLYSRATPLLATAPDAEISRNDPGVLRGDVEVNGLTFRYSPDAKPILNGLSLKMAQGEFVAITGPSGSGKSTLIRLLLGFEEAESGGVFYDGRDLRGVSLQRLRRQIGVVLQNGKLMPGTIFENIQGATGATLEECWDAAARAGLDEEISAMPMGMHTVLTEGTTALSGGQAQRIMIARAIVSKPRIMVMDEATSALDNRTQAMVTESLDKLSITRIVIAHRLSTIVNADRIYVLKHGEVVESGNYEELMKLDGVFADLARRQQS